MKATITVAQSEWQRAQNMKGGCISQKNRNHSMYSRYRGTYITQKRGQITMKSVNIQRQESFCQRLKLKAQKQAVVKSSLDAKELKTGT